MQLRLISVFGIVYGLVGVRSYSTSLIMMARNSPNTHAFKDYKLNYYILKIRRKNNVARPWKKRLRRSS